MALEDVTLTEFLQHSGKILSRVAEGEIRLHRRDGEDLVLTTSAQMQALQETLRAFVAITDGGKERVGTVFPWFGFLEPADQIECLRDLGEAANATVLTGRLSQLEEIIDEWPATALATWDDKGLQARSNPSKYHVSQPSTHRQA